MNRFFTISIFRVFVCALVVCLVSATGFYASARSNADRQLPAVTELQAEFDMPIYRNPSQAALTVGIPEGMDSLRQASVSVISPEGQEVWSGSFTLSPGWNSCVLEEIDSLAAGRYMATITVGATTMKRMLRIERVPAVALPNGTITLRKLFFTPDNWLFESFSNLEIRYAKPEFTDAGCPKDPAMIMRYPLSFNRATDGGYVIKGHDNRYRRGYLYSNDPQEFTLRSDAPEGFYALTDEAIEPEPNEYIFQRSNILGSAPGHQQYEMYDSACHGSYTLNDIGIINNMDPYDFGCVKAGYRTYWVVARTSSDKTVFLREAPLFRDVELFRGDAFDDGFTTNDNFGNFWLSGDGETLFLARVDRRFAVLHPTTCPTTCCTMAAVSSPSIAPQTASNGVTSIPSPQPVRWTIPSRSSTAGTSSFSLMRGCISHLFKHTIAGANRSTST